MMLKNGQDSASPFKVAAAQRKNICPEWLNWRGSLAAISSKKKF
jgi:hypothetical protein